MATCRVLIPDGESHFAGGVLRALGAAGRYESCVNARSAYAPARFSRQCARFAVAGQSDDFVERVARWSREWSADVLLPVDEDAILATIVARRELERVVQIPPLPNADAFNIARDKAQFAAFLGTHGLPHPPTICLSPTDSSAPGAGEIRYPVLLKPARSSNGIGIIRFETPAALSEHLRSHPQAATASIVQSFVEGSDIDCSVLCVDGAVVAHTVQRQIGARPGAFRSAGAIEFLDHEPVARLAARIAGALRWSGIAHMDLRIDRRSGQATCIEINPRFWGSLLGSLHAGVNFADLWCRLALRQLLPSSQRRNCRYLSGSAAVQSWFQWPPRANPAALIRTAWQHIWSDPGPEMVEAAAALIRPWR